MNSAVVVAEFTQGRAVFTPGLIELLDLTGRHGGGTFDLNGTVKTREHIDVELQIGYLGLLMHDQLQAFLPRVVHDTLAAMQFRDGPQTTLSNATLRLRRLADEASRRPSEATQRWRTDFTGQIQTQNAAFVAGIDFTEVDATFDVKVNHQPGRPAGLEILAEASRLRAVGREMTNVSGPIRLVDSGQAVSVPALRGDCYGGAVTARALLGVGERKEYELDAEMVGVSLEEFFGASPDGPPSAEVAAESRGEVYATLGLAGERGDSTTRRGRGIFRVLNGRIAGIPLLLQLVQLMQFTLPMKQNFEYADVDYYIDGDTVHFPRMLFESTIGDNAALQLLGEGTMDFNTFDINVRFRSRGGIAIIRDVVGGIGDQLYAIEVTGPLREPVARVVPLPRREN